MRFTGFISVLTTFWPRDFMDRMPYKNTRMIGRVGRAGPMKGPYEAHRTQQSTGSARVPVRYLHDCQWTFYLPKMIGSPCLNVVYGQFSGTGYTAPVRVRNLRRIAWVRTACHTIIHGFSGFWLLPNRSQDFGSYRTRKLPGSFM